MYPLICADCRWFLPEKISLYDPGIDRHIDYTSKAYQRCKASEEVDLVTGDKNYKFCMTMRMEGAPCGPDGKLFSLNISDPEGEQHGE